MELKVVIDKKLAFMILGGILILAGAIYGYAQSPAIFGHDWFEIDNRPAGLDDGDNNTNAKTECGNNKFLDGDGQCRTASQIVNDGGGGSISLTSCSWYALPGGGNGNTGSFEKICPGNGIRVVVGYKNTRDGDWTRTGHASIRCCKISF